MKSFCNIYKIIYDIAYIRIRTPFCVRHYTEEAVTTLSKQTVDSKTKATSTNTRKCVCSLGWGLWVFVWWEFFFVVWVFWLFSFKQHLGAKYHSIYRAQKKMGTYRAVEVTSQNLQD